MPAIPLFLKSNEKQALDSGFLALFGKAPQQYFSAPGRTEIGGNHTDHQWGRVLAAAVNLHSYAAVLPRDNAVIRIQSRGYPLCTVDLQDLTPRKEEVNTTAALVRGVAAGFQKLNYPVRGFDAYCESTVLPGSGLSSSAAYEVLVGTIINHLFCRGAVPPAEIARIGQYAENVFFGKPCGLMDQATSAVGNLVYMDFYDPEATVIEPVAFDFSACGHALCIIDSGAGHENLTDEYAAIPRELKEISACFQKEVLSQIDEADFYAAIPALRKACGDRAVLRAIHFYEENARVPLEAEALKKGDFDAFLELVRKSGQSSWMYLQNVIPAGSREHQDMALTLALCQHCLQGRGACRVHGGGFAGTVQAFVPEDLLEDFRAEIDACLGTGACHILSIRPQGGTTAVWAEA